MDVVADTGAWAEQTFADVDLGDPRRTRRLVQAAAQIAAHPEKAFTQVFAWNDLRGFYRLCAQSTATTVAVQTPHWQQTRQAMSQQPLVLILHDTTELDYSSHHHLTGRGQIGNEFGKGFLQHNSLAILPQPRQVLGLAFQQWKVRQPAPAGESAYQRKRRQRESDLWADGFRGVGPAPEGCCWVNVCDRGSDDYEALRAARHLHHHVLFRGNQNRLVFVTPDLDRPEYLLDHARTLPTQGSDTVEIPGHGGRPPRTATVQLAGAAIWMPAPAGTPQRKQQPSLPLWVIRIWEDQPPAGVQEPLEWFLLCSLPSSTLAELKERRDWYCCRWLIEIFHNIEKSGCQEEARRFETAGRMETCVAILALIAVRVFQLRSALETKPQASAEEVGTADEIAVLRRYVKHKATLFTVRDFVRGVAKLGGFLGRKHDGDPGVRALWRGYQRLQDMVFALHLLTADANDSG
jgi:Transposase DNA-binding/Transposase Tn5 dimerisation domain